MFRKLILLNYLFVGCTIGPKYEPPSFENIPCEWHSQVSEGMQMDGSDCFIWWQSLGDPILTSLLERAAVQNVDLYISAMRILEARVEQKGGEASRYPHLDGSVTYGHAQFNQNTLDHLLDICSPHSRVNKRNINFFEAGFDAEWEIDLFGMNVHEINALKAKKEASEEEFYDMWVTLSAELAKNYIELRGFQQRLEIIERKIISQKETLYFSADLINAGFVSNVDQIEAQAALNQLKAERLQIELLISKAIHRLSILLSYAPGELFAELASHSMLPSLPYQKPIGMPSDLLRRRPDIRKVERDLAASNEYLYSAVAALFPRLTLQGFIGGISSFCSNSFVWFGGSQLLLPIFNSKLLRQDVCLNEIKVRQAFYTYQKIVLEALEEAENALSAFHFQLERNGYLAAAQQASWETYELTMQLYEQGFKGYLDVESANRSFLTAEEVYLQNQVELLLSYVSLYKALGGGWNIECAMEYPCE
jgi:multidrug efflux system outer membrane protein